jgi:hypothetical protein
MLPQKPKILVAVMMATLLSLGSLSLMPLDVYASHSYEAGVQGDNIPDNTHIDLTNLTLPFGGVFPLYDSSPNFVSGHLLYKGPCEVGDEDDDGTPFEPIVSVIAGHIDESANLTHVDFVPLYYVGHASPLAGICVYHAHIPDPLEGGSPRVTDIDLVNYVPNTNVTFNAGDAVDVNIQRSLGNIGDFYAGNVLLPLDLIGGNNPVLDLNAHEDANVQQQFVSNLENLKANDDEDMNIQQQFVSNLESLKANDVINNLPFELANENNNQIFNLDEEHDNDNDNDNDNEDDEEDDDEVEDEEDEDE